MKDDHKPNEGLLKAAPDMVKRQNKFTFLFYVFLVTVLLFFSIQFTQTNHLKSAALFLCGFVIWILAEYILHRFVFQNHHAFPLFNKAHYILHGINLSGRTWFDKIYMPPITGTLFFLALFVIYFLFLKADTIIFIAGLITGYLFYAFIFTMIPRKTGKLIFHKLFIRDLKLENKLQNKIHGLYLPFFRILFTTPPTKSKSKKK